MINRIVFDIISPSLEKTEKAQRLLRILTPQMNIGKHYIVSFPLTIQGFLKSSLLFTKIC